MAGLEDDVADTDEPREHGCGLVLDGLPHDEAVRLRLLAESKDMLKYLFHLRVTGAEVPHNALDFSPQYPDALNRAADRFLRRQMLSVAKEEE